MVSKLTLTYYGHACFKVSSVYGTVLFDPYGDGSVPGLTLPRNLVADQVFCSHEHHDHNAAGLVHLEKQPKEVEHFEIVVPHDDANGSKRGMTNLTFVTLGDLLIAHLGDIGRMPTEEEYEVLKKADVVLLPCAGFYTIDAVQAYELIQHLKSPSLKILMHFRDKNTGYEVQEDITSIVSVIPDVHRKNVSSVEVDAAAIPDEIITLTVANA